MRARTHLWLAALAALGGGCEERPAEGPPDSAVDQVELPDGGLPDSAAIMIEFTVTGCATFVTPGGDRRCSGTAPLALRLSPVGSSSFDVFRWDFGDGSPVSIERSPSHTYTMPGRYSVTLTGGGSAGSMMISHDGLVEVEPLALGGACQIDGQCTAGAVCLCGSGQPCGPAFTAGMCAASCATSPCPAGSICADLARSIAGDPSASADPWRAPTCLATCQSDEDCAGGLSCRVLPAPGSTPAWVRACFASVPSNVGNACRDARGTLAGSLCSTGLCADLGALGMCSVDCSAGASACPPGTACASFADGRQLCLRECTSATDCDRDPLLGCEPPGAAGALGFTAPAGKTYCAPTTCTAYGDCAPAGVCASGHCVLEP